MKVYKGSGSTAPFILNLDKGECSPSRLGLFTPENEPRYPFNWRLGGNLCLCGYFAPAKIWTGDCPSSAPHVWEFCASKWQGIFHKHWQSVGLFGGHALSQRQHKSSMTQITKQCVTIKIFGSQQKKIKIASAENLIIFSILGMLFTTQFSIFSLPCRAWTPVY
jgi:hypothetical protein